MKLPLWIAMLCLLAFQACTHDHPLPILGNRVPVMRIENGKTITDTLYQTIPPFAFVNQYGDSITLERVKGKVYIADFFFTSCPTICPIMKKEMIRVFEAYKNNPDVLILSHTIDPEYDTVALLRDYAERLGASGNQWHFLTGNKDSIYTLAQNGYYATALPDSTEPGGYVHSGGFILVDRHQRVRGLYDGTLTQSVDELIKDIAILLREP